MIATGSKEPMRSLIGDIESWHDEVQSAPTACCFHGAK
jgi:hypothetical protein